MYARQCSLHVNILPSRPVEEGGTTVKLLTSGHCVNAHLHHSTASLTNPHAVKLVLAKRACDSDGSRRSASFGTSLGAHQTKHIAQGLHVRDTDVAVPRCRRCHLTPGPPFCLLATGCFYQPATSVVIWARATTIGGAVGATTTAGRSPNNSGGGARREAPFFF